MGKNPPEFGRSVNPIQTMGADHVPHTTASPPGFKKLSTPLGLDSGSHSEAPFFYSKICCLSGFHPRLHAYSNTYKSSLRFFCRLQWDRNLSKDEYHNFLYVTKGLLISKKIFGVFHSPKKRTKTIRLEVP